MTTRPPLSPVARRSPSWLNSTHEIISAAIKEHNVQVYKRFCIIYDTTYKETLM